jgi:site-specific DNA-methyltransferase (adenine-specific)
MADRNRTIIGDFVLDPFLGSGTTAVVAKKLRRKFLGIEQEQKYCCYALKRLKMADDTPTIQGYSNGVFWERNSLTEQKKYTKYNLEGV